MRRGQRWGSKDRGDSTRRRRARGDSRAAAHALHRRAQLRGVRVTVVHRVERRGVDRFRRHGGTGQEQMGWRTSNFGLGGAYPLHRRNMQESASDWAFPLYSFSPDFSDSLQLSRLLVVSKMYPSVNTTDSGPVFFSSFSFSNNLVEVGALTALVGSSVAEALVLGNRGAAGVAWAATSSFGTISVIKACVSGVASGWLRETLGIRTAASDLAVGLELPQDSARAGQIRRNMGEPLAIFCYTNANNERKPRSAQRSDIYALDHSTALMLRGVPDTVAGNPIQVFTYASYIYLTLRFTRFQVPTIFLSATKILEVYVLWTHGAYLLGLTSALPWVFFFIGAVVVEIIPLLLPRLPEPQLSTLDIVTGQLPMVSRRGGSRKIILGAVENARISIVWRSFWAAGALVSTASIIMSYIVLGQQTDTAVLIWAGFQLLWLGVRILVYHLAEPANPMLMRLLVERVIDLTLALAKSQTFIHPRGQPQYAEDAFNMADFKLAVFGDTALSSAMWITGSDVIPMDLYDSCIVVFNVRESRGAYAIGRTIAVPAARVLSGVSVIPVDSESLSWWYWIPCRNGLWLEMQLPTKQKVLGIREAAVRTDEQVSALLTAGKLNIGLKNVDEVKGVVELSRRARESFLELLS
ncbi:hypothetical protein B0H10DRAFT_1978032 [Mycena sp. CBHHK59/15]|nr:hypothetical protein B0H10DRAFT_1978032 [Mycena sp. CBHHK59/15]